MTDIAIWGYGNFGRRTVYCVEEFYAGRFRIVKVYDANPKLWGTPAGSQGLVVEDPNTIVADYRAGAFEQVVVSIVDSDSTRDIKSMLEKEGVPELMFGSEDDYYPASDFEQMEPSVAIDQPGYNVWAFPTMCMAAPNFESFEKTFLFDNRGHALKEHWGLHKYELPYSGILMFPYPFDSTLPRRIKLEGSWCNVARAYMNNYWHFTFEAMDEIFLLEEAGYQGRYIVPEASWLHELMELLGVSRDRYITTFELEKGVIYEFDELVCVMPEGDSDERRPLCAEVLVRMADRIIPKLPDLPDSPKRLFVKRTGRRRLLNDDDIFTEYGFEVFVPQEHSVAEQMATFRNADVIITPHGANSTNCLYMREGSVFVELFPSRWLQRCCIEVARRKGLRYIATCDLDQVWFNDVRSLRQDFTMPESLLRSTIENALLLAQK